MLPVTARVGDWLERIVAFVKEMPEASSLLGEGDRKTLLANTWARILLLRMSENNFHFAVTRCDLGASSSSPPTEVVSGNAETSPSSPAGAGISSRQRSGGDVSLGRHSSSKTWIRQMRDTPTMATVETIQGFIAKCQALNIDNDEYRLLSKIVLFNKGKYWAGLALREAILHLLHRAIMQ